MTFYEPLGGNHYRATKHTVGPWDPGSQHGGPPAALLARAIEVTSPSWPATVARMSVDILSPIPVSDMLVRSRVLRPGRSVELVEAELDAFGRTVMRAQAWRIRQAELQLPRDDQTPDPVPMFPAGKSPLLPSWGAATSTRSTGDTSPAIGPMLGQRRSGGGCAIRFCPTKNRPDCSG